MNWKFELPDDSSCNIFTIVSSISSVRIPTNPPVHIYINRTNNRQSLKKKKMVKLQIPETRKLSDSAKKLTEKAKNWENEHENEVLKQFQPNNLVDNQYQEKYKMLYTFAPNNCYGYLLNVDQVI